MLLKRAIVVTALLTIACALLIPTLSAAQTPSSTSSLLVKLVDGLSAQEQADVIARNGGVEISSIPALRLHVIQVAPADLPQVLANYQADPQVVNAEENKTRQSQAFPTDPLYLNHQWSLPKIGWDQVFGTVTPTGSAIVAILDTGVDAQHPDLAGNVISGTSILDGSLGTTDPSGHGTWVAGIAAARTNTTSAEGIAGVAYAGVRIMPVTVLDVNGLGQDSDVIAGVIWAADHGADVIVMAFSNPGFSQNLQDALDYAWSKNVVLVAATGNDGVSTPTFPAGDRGVMGVSATDSNDNLAPFSSSGQSVFIAAPGTDIQTTTIGDAYTVISGTSASAAIVAGAAAFMRAVDPTLSNGVIVGRIARMADPAGTPDQTGNGRINMARALADTGIDFIQPAGAAPVGAGGPFVGPYRAAGTATIKGTVKSSASGSPAIGAATVTCTSCNGTPSTTTAADGSYSLAVNYQGGGVLSFTVEASHPDYLSNTGTGSVANGGTASSVDITLTPKRPTTTSWEPTSATVAPGGTQNFTIRVADVGSGTKSNPTGTVTFSSNVSGDIFTTCSLRPSSGNTATCTITVTSSATTGNHTLTAIYGRDTTHAPSTGTATLTVTSNVTVIFDASNITDVATGTTVLSVTIGATTTSVLKSDLPKSFSVASGTSVGYSYNSPLAGGTG